MTSISNGTTTIVPDLILGYDVSTESNNILHRIIGRTSPDVSLRADSLRTGELRLFFQNRTSAFAARTLHTAASVFTLVDAGMPELNMTYVRRGAMTITLDPETRQRWILTIGFDEVAP